MQPLAERTGETDKTGGFLNALRTSTGKERKCVPALRSMPALPSMTHCLQ